eukprot:TRINITY_DN29562_c0_g1_i1.p1 TRINITY_DN29562_c0_g1~~TRINITY_DN29562_c0_g1_i1.p1  ORF type:complete len:124 (-),score=6.72 TRINITY_DN29562_c0_g1_i1:84-428(-)
MDVFTNISRYSKDQRLKFGHLTMFDLPELLTGSDHDFEPHINWKIWKNRLFLFIPIFNNRVNCQDVLAHISRYKRNQWLKFGHLAVFDLPELMTGSNLDCGTHINRKIWKNGLF